MTVTGCLREGETATYSVGGKDYEVTVLYVVSGSVKFVINGELTGWVSLHETKCLLQLLRVAVKKVDFDAVEFELAACSDLEVKYGKSLF